MGVCEADEVPADAVGRRVACGAERATVRYIGPVPPTEGLWLGVEWDQPDRGKHNGSHSGVQYFTCRHPRGASFVRPSKVSFGVDYLSAVQEAYGSDVQDAVSEASSNNVDLRLKELRNEQLWSMLLSRSQVNGPGEDGQVHQVAPNVQHLDLCGTLLCCWEDVASICLQLELLQSLQLSSNRLRLPAEPASLSQAFSRLTVLAINDCHLTWPQILQCAPMWPQLKVLSAQRNAITELQRPDGVLQLLETLSLCGNQLVQETVLCLGSLPRLENLRLSETGLSELCFQDAAPGSQTSLFPALTELNLDNNNISEWDVVSELSKLPRLVKFSCSGNRLSSSDGNPKTVTQLLIAKLGRVLVLNRCDILHEERRGAELDYLKLFGEEWLKAGGPGPVSDEFLRKHPRYLELVEKYGAPEEGEMKKQKPLPLTKNLIKITFVFPDHPDRQPIQKKLSVFMELQKVRGLLHRLLKVPAADLKLTYSSPKMVGREFDINNDQKTLSFYAVEDGDQILVRWS
ncbi:tubulin-specific chaperone E [Nelusetta ayraudi]|uniref:tubulin-specific chaperone E n=1 Tax=Nelusetta ayraudi TaxID=303726 RepID=UPI003F70B388